MLFHVCRSKLFLYNFYLVEQCSHKILFLRQFWFRGNSSLSVQLPIVEYQSSIFLFCELNNTLQRPCTVVSSCCCFSGSRVGNVGATRIRDLEPCQNVENDACFSLYCSSATNILYLQYHNAYSHQTWRGGDTHWMISTYQLHDPLAILPFGITWLTKPLYPHTTKLINAYCPLTW